MNKYTFFSKFKEENCLLYEKIKGILTNLTLGDIIYFDEVDVFIKEFLTQYSLLERQLLLSYLISENFSQYEDSFEIFSKFEGVKNDKLFHNETTLDVLNIITKSNGYFELYEKNEGK